LVEEQRGDLANFQIRDDFTPAEKAALSLAEQMTLDSNHIPDECFDQLHEFYNEGEVVELMAAIGLFNYFNRFNNALQIEPTKPGEGAEQGTALDTVIAPVGSIPYTGSGVRGGEFATARIE